MKKCKIGAGASAPAQLVVGEGGGRGCGGGGRGRGRGGGGVEPLDLELSPEQRPEQPQERLVAHRRVLQQEPRQRRLPVWRREPPSATDPRTAHGSSSNNS